MILMKKIPGHLWTFMGRRLTIVKIKRVYGTLWVPTCVPLAATLTGQRLLTA